MPRKGKITIIVSIVLSFVVILPVANFPASDSDEWVIPEPHKAPVKDAAGFPAGWTDDIRLTNTNVSLQDNQPRIAVDGEHVHIVWDHDLQIVGPGQYDIYYINSNDGGENWNEPVEIMRGTPDEHYRHPDIAVKDNNVHTVWDSIELGRVLYRNSSDGGITWSDEKNISVDDGWHSDFTKIAVNGSELHVVWVDQKHREESVPWNTELYYIRSLDGGITWDDGLGNVGQERRITNALYESWGQDIAVEGDAIHLVWPDARNGISTGEIYYKRSLDKGATWDDGLGNINQDRVLTSNLTCHHGLSAIAVNGSTIHVAWVDRVWPGPNFYIYYRNSTDNGATWNPIRLLVDSGNVSNGPSMDVEENEVHVVWPDRRDNGTTDEIYYKNSTDGGVSWSDDVRLTYDDERSYLPTIAVHNSTAHVTWYDARDLNFEIYYKRYPDFLDTSPPGHSNELPPPDSYKDAPGTNISVHVTDPSGVNETTIQLYVNGSLVTHTLTPITNGFNVSYISPGFDPGVVECRIVADDNLSNTLDFTWNFTVLATYEIQLHEGWNLISVPHVQVDTAINEVLRDIDGKWDYIQNYDATSGQWKSHATFWPENLTDLNEVNNTMAIWINITEPNVNLTVRGHISSLTKIPLYAGWNLIGYPSLTTETVANALWGTGADKVEVFDPAEPYRIREVGPTYVLRPGEGYWVHVPVDSVWVVDW